MGKDSKILLAIIATTLVASLALMALFAYVSKQAATSTEQPEPQTRQVIEETPVPTVAKEPGTGAFEQEQKMVAIGSKEVAKGAFQKAENGSIFLSENGKTIAYPLAEEEIVVACTGQELTSATELDYYQIVKVNVVKLDSINSSIPKNEVVVVFAQQEKGVYKVHTIALAASKCPN